MAPLRLWLKGIGIESGSIVLDVEIVQPIQLMQHEARPESGRAPLIDIMVDMRGLTSELTARCKKVTIVLEIVHAYFKSVAGKLFSQLTWNTIVTFRNEVEGRTYAQLHFQLHEVPTSA